LRVNRSLTGLRCR